MHIFLSLWSRLCSSSISFLMDTKFAIVSFTSKTLRWKKYPPPRPTLFTFAYAPEDRGKFGLVEIVHKSGVTRRTLPVTIIHRLVSK